MMRQSKLALAILVALVLPGCSRADVDLPLDSIIQRNTDALGGEAALGAVQSVWRQRNATTFTLRQRPNLLLVVLLNDTGGIRYAEGYDGQIAWEVVDDGPKREASERAREALWHTTQFPSVLNPLSQMSALGHELQLVGSDTIEGVAYHRVVLELSDGFKRDYFINAVTFQIERARDRRRFHAYEEDIQPIESIWSDYREIDGVWLPYTTGERNYETGERLSGGTMRQIRLNVVVPKAVFSLDGSLAPFLELVGELTDSAVSLRKDRL